MDTVQYIKRGVTHRNKIRIHDGSVYLTVPISKDFSMSRIKDVELPREKIWRKDHWRAIQHNYLKAYHFSDYMQFFNDIYHHDHQYLWELNMQIISYLLKCFDINVEIIKTSDLDLDPELKHTDLIIDILRKIDASTYLSGPSGKNYLEIEKFNQNNINLEFTSFQHPVYEQRYPGFEPNLSAIDLLFNMGSKSGELINKSGGIESKMIRA
jgi:hypothetical protein